MWDVRCCLYFLTVGKPGSVPNRDRCFAQQVDPALRCLRSSHKDASKSDAPYAMQQVVLISASGL